MMMFDSLIVIRVGLDKISSECDHNSKHYFEIVTDHLQRVAKSICTCLYPFPCIRTHRNIPTCSCLSILELFWRVHSELLNTCL